MTKVLHMSLEELALQGLYFEPMLYQLLKHSLKLSEVDCDAVAVNDDVIQVHQFASVFENGEAHYTVQRAFNCSQTSPLVW